MLNKEPKEAHSRYLKVYPPHLCRMTWCQQQHFAYPKIEVVVPGPQRQPLTLSLVPWEIVQVAEGVVSENNPLAVLCHGEPGTHIPEGTPGQQTTMLHFN